MFNPALLRDGEGWLFAYRVVGADGRRRIGLCRLDQRLAIVPGSAQPLSDRLHFRTDRAFAPEATTWFADPRLARIGGRILLYWNSGWHEPRNWQFLQELDARSLAPVGPARELVLQGERRKLEKNWTLFEGPAGQALGVYSIMPHRVLGVSLAGDGDVVCDEVACTEWSLPAYPNSHGGLRGGAPPVLHDGELWSFCHSVHDAPDGYRYAAAVYRFSSAAPYSPTAAPIAPLELGGEFRQHRRYPRLNPAVGEVIYPCGAARDGARWLVSHGINDEQCAISVLATEYVSAALEPAVLAAPPQP